MKTNSNSESEYPEDFIARLQFKWGEGFLSPGGEHEVTEILRDVNLDGRKVLDIGCGLGAIDVLLIEKHKASEVHGIDVERSLLAEANKYIEKRGLSAEIQFTLVEPGPFPFPSESFDIAFSKDALIHIPDKLELYKNVNNTLMPGGIFVASDWYKADGPCNELSDFMINELGFTFSLSTLQETIDLLSETGFEEIKGRDRHDWFKDDAKKDLARLKGPMYKNYVQELGIEGAQVGISANEKLVSILDTGQLRPGHIFARKLG